MTRVVIGLLVILTCDAVRALPLIHFKLEGRLQGSDDPFASTLHVSLGNVVEYRLRMRMAEPPAKNSNFYASGDYMPGRHGMNSLSLAVAQSAHESIQVDFNTAAELQSHPLTYGRGWDAGVGARGGSPSLRPGSPWHDLTDVRPIHWPGVFSGAVEETVLSGQFSVAAISGHSGLLSAEWGTTSGGGWFDGNLFFVLGPNHPDVLSGLRLGLPSEASSDPFAEFAPLTLTANATPNPEPSTIVLGAVAIAGLLLLRKRMMGTS